MQKFMAVCVSLLALALYAFPGANADEKKDPQPNRGGAGGKGGAGSGGDGGAGGDGQAILPVDLSEEQMKAIERSLTAEQKKLFKEYVELTVKLYARRAGKNQPAMDAAALRKWEL